MLNILVCDDDNYTVRLLKKIISQNEFVSNVYEATDGESAIEVAASHSIEIAFLDIDMPNVNGLDAAKAIKAINKDTEIVFVTAYRDYAIDSYDVKALDYILKPVDFSRVSQNIDAIIKKQQKKPNTIKPQTSIMIRDKNEYHMIELSQILFFEKQKNKLIIKLRGKEYEANLTLTEVLDLLDSNFVRSHKSYIINLNNVNRMELYGDTSYIVYFNDTDPSISALMTKEVLKQIHKK